MQLEPIRKYVTMQKMARYSGAGNFHSNDAAGERQGLGGALVQGGQLVGYLNEMLIHSLGAGFIAGGELSVNFIKPARPGDMLTTHGTLTGTVLEDGRERGMFDIWLENQKGEKLTVGTASAFLSAE